MSSRSSVDRAPRWCLGGNGFDSRRRLRLFPLSHAHIMLISSRFKIILKTAVDSLIFNPLGNLSHFFHVFVHLLVGSKSLVLQGKSKHQMMLHRVYLMRQKGMFLLLLFIYLFIYFYLFIFIYLLLLYLLHLQCDTYITYITYINHDIQYTKYYIHITLHAKRYVPCMTILFFYDLLSLKLVAKSIAQ